MNPLAPSSPLHAGPCWLVLLSLILMSALAWAGEDAAPGTAAAMPDRPVAATLYVLNVSGATLFAANQDVTDNGRDLVSLPRMTWKRLTIATGAHEFRFKPFQQGRRVTSVEALAGGTYYLVVAYSPARSWAMPFAGDSMLIKMVSEVEAVAAMKDMKEQ